MGGWSRALNVYLVRPVEGRLKLLRTRGSYWKAVVERRSKRFYVGSVPAWLVNKPCEEVMDYLTQKRGVELSAIKGGRAKRRLVGDRANEASPPAKLVGDVIVEWKKYKVRGDLWLLHVRKGLNRWALCVTQLKGKKKFSISYVNKQELNKILDLKEKSNETALIKHIAQRFNIKIHYPKSAKTWEDEKLEAIENGDKAKLIELYLENPALFTEDEKKRIHTRIDHHETDKAKMITKLEEEN